MIKFTDAINILVKEHHPDCGWGYIGNIDQLKDLNALTIGNDVPAKFTYDDVVAKKTELENAEPMKVLREERNWKLQETDWMANSDVTMSDAWKKYRKDLRDLPSTAKPKLDENGQLINITWPTKPE